MLITQGKVNPLAGHLPHRVRHAQTFERSLLTQELHHVVTDDFDVIEVVHAFAAACLVKTQTVVWTFLSDVSQREGMITQPLMQPRCRRLSRDDHPNHLVTPPEK